MNQSIKITRYKNKYKSKIEELINNLKLKNYDFNDANDILKIPIPKTETYYKKLSQFVIEFPQKIVDNIDEFNGFIIIWMNFKCLKKWRT